MYKTIQVQANVDLGTAVSNNQLIRAGGVARIHNGWYTITYNGVRPDCSTVVSARRNKKGQLK